MNDEYKIIAQLYDFLLEPFLGGIRRCVVNECSGYKGKKILDLCGGTGKQLKMFSQNGFTELHCMDLSEAMLRMAKRGCDSISVYNRDAAETGFDDSCFDLVIISFAIHEKNRMTQQAMMNEAFRLLREDGALVVVDFVFDHETLLIGKVMISAVEFMAGRDHYKNFRSYLQNGGLSSLACEDKFLHLKSKRRAFNAVTVSVYRKIMPNRIGK